MLLRHDGKMVTKCNGCCSVLTAGSYSSKSFFGGYDLPRKKVTSTG